MTPATQQKPRQVPVRKLVPANGGPCEPTQAEALLRDAALVLALTRRVKAEIVSGRAVPA